MMMRSRHGGEVKALLLLDRRSIVSLAPKQQAHRYREGSEVTGNEQGNLALNVAADDGLIVDEWNSAGTALLL